MTIWPHGPAENSDLLSLSFLSYFSNFHTYWCSPLNVKYICFPILCITYVELFLAQWNISNLHSKWKQKYQYASYRVFVTVVQNWNMLINFNKISPTSELTEIKSKVLRLSSVGTWVDRERLMCKTNRSIIANFCFLFREVFNPLNPELNPICYLLALLGAHRFLHVSRIRVKLLTFRPLMSYIYIYGAPILDVSRSHTTTQHSR